MNAKPKTPNNAKPRGKATVKPAVARSHERGRGLKKTPSDNSRHPKAPVLSAEARVRVVELLACYRTPTVIKRTIEREFGVSVTLPAINYYNPDSRYKENPLDANLMRVFNDARGEYLLLARHGIANQNVRLASLNEIYWDLLDRGNVVAAARLAEQVAKDEGGLYSNRKEVAEPLPVPLTAIEREQELERLTQELFVILERGKRRENVNGATS